jgi:hypothetical protein
MGEGSLEKYQDGSEAKLCERNALQAYKPEESLQVVQLVQIQESCSASKPEERISTNLSAHTQMVKHSAIHETSLS